MIVIHHLLQSQSERIIWLMEELGLPYRLVSYEREPTMMAPPALRALCPIGQAPVIEDGPLVMAESLAIMTWIMEVHGGGRLRIAPGEAGYADYLYWFHYSTGSLMPAAMQHMGAVRDPAAAASPRGLLQRQRFANHLGMIDARLGAHPWLAGDDFTAADIACHFSFGTMSLFAPIDLADYPAIRAWRERVSARAAYRRAMQAAGHAVDPATVGQAAAPTG